jgi:hypothetical protein
MPLINQSIMASDEVRWRTQASKQSSWISGSLNSVRKQAGSNQQE